MNKGGKAQPTRPGARSAPVASPINRDKLRAALRRIGNDQVFHMLDEAIDLLPPAKLAKLAERYLDVKGLRPDAPGKKNLLAEVRAFDKASRAGQYYESFDVNSKNYRDESIGTRAFISECRRLLDRCVDPSSKGDAAEIREAIEIILGLLGYIDECHDDVLFFADEGGAWQVGVDWKKVLPALFLCLSRTMEPDDYARRVVEVVNEFDKYRSGVHLAAARRLGTVAQRRALRDAEAAR